MIKLPRIRMPRLTGWPNLPLLSSVRGRIIAGFGLLVIILVVVVGSSTWLHRDHLSDMAEMEEHATTSSLLENARLETTSAALILQRYIVTGDETQIPEFRSSVAIALDSSGQARAHLEETGGHDEQIARLDGVLAVIKPLAAGAEEIITMRQGGDVEGAAAALEGAVPTFGRFALELEEAAETERQEVAALRSQADRTGDLAFWLLILSGVLGGTLALAVSLATARSILKPLGCLESAALAVSGGDLEARAPATGPRELARLGASLNRMTESLLDASKRRELEETLRRLNRELEKEHLEIEALNRSLEEKVKERTQELRLANEELRERNRQLLDARAQAATDGLTGLRNHRAFHERIGEEASRAQETGHPVGLIMLDIDNFKRVNDSEGHLAGDSILRQLAPVLAAAAPREDAYRYGGDEFAILLPGADCEKTAGIAERLRRAVETQSDGERVTVSLGVASFPDAAASVEELIYGADVAMYWAKSAGKNRVGDWGKLIKHRADGDLPWYSADRAVHAPDVVVALGAALAAKDPTTSAHTERCSWYAAKLAEQLGLGEKETSAVRLASLLHDVGKLAIPDAVLFKPGPLNEEEWAQMKQHPTAALHMLGQIRSLTDATPAILHHHEHFDGSGYPDGLAGEDIPIASRILLVTDAFDAMTTDRPYRKAMPVEAAIEELKRNTGSQFDPTVVDAFFRLLARHGAQPLRRMAAAQAQPVAAGAASSRRTKQ